jgi:serine/threonine-protein kinase
MDATVLRPAAAPPSRASQTLPVGSSTHSGGVIRQVGRYQVIDRLGRGGMASVFKAHDPGIDRVIALKFLHASLCEDDQYRARFLQEARAAGMLSHPNIVTVHDVGEIEGRPFMAMELIEGDPLNEVMSSNQPLPLKDALEIALQLARALDYAHSKGIVHRDIKPANVIRVRGSNVVKVTDFGIAHLASAAQEQTRAGDVLGTPQYMSPEQALGQPVDGRSDLFSVGIVLYQMLTGARPFEGDSIVALAVMIAREDPPPIDKLRPDLPADVRRIVERCMAKLPAKRYATGKELAEALAKSLGVLQEAEREAAKARIVPIRIKWAGMMAAIVAVVMALSTWVITQKQTSALSVQVMDYGASLARFLAAQNAVNALAEEWEPVEVAIQEVMKTRDFQSITIIDREGTVRASGEEGLVGKPYAAPRGQALKTLAGGVTVQRYTVAGDEAVLGFEVPIRFKDNSVGRVALGLSEKPMSRVIDTTRALMATLVLVTVLAVAIAMYFVAQWFARPIHTLVDAVGELALGRLDHRIGEKRNDEFGQLIEAMDQMAAKLQARYAPEPPSPAFDAAPTMPLSTLVTTAGLTSISTAGWDADPVTDSAVDTPPEPAAKPADAMPASHAAPTP